MYNKEEKSVYEILGVPKTAVFRTIEDAYSSRLNKCRRERLDEDEIHRAFEKVSTPEKAFYYYHQDTEKPVISKEPIDPIQTAIELQLASSSSECTLIGMALLGLGATLFVIGAALCFATAGLSAHIGLGLIFGGIMLASFGCCSLCSGCLDVNDFTNHDYILPMLP